MKLPFFWDSYLRDIIKADNLTPTDIFYDREYLWVGKLNFSMPDGISTRLAFARTLALFPEPTSYKQYHHSIINENTIIHEPVFFGYGSVIGGDGFGYETDED